MIRPAPSTERVPATLAPGAPAPDFRAPSNKGHTLGPESFEDRLAVVLVFLDGVGSHDEQSVLWAFDASLPEFGKRRVQLLGVVPTTPRDLRETTDGAAMTLLADQDRSIRAAFDVGVDGPFTVVVDRHGTVAEILTGDEGVRPASVVVVVDRLLDERPEAFEAHPTDLPDDAGAAGRGTP